MRRESLVFVVFTSAPHLLASIGSSKWTLEYPLIVLDLGGLQGSDLGLLKETWVT